jgi:hypothetical protein
MKSTNIGIFFMSLGSNKFNEAIKQCCSFDFNCEVEQFDVFIFDIQEILNGIFMNENNVMQQVQEIDNIISKLNTNFIAINASKRELIMYSAKRKELNPYLQSVYNEYFSNSVFESHCNNQVFQNLQPKLRRLAIDSKKSKLIEILIPFLLAEIAVYLFVYDKGEYYSIYGLEAEMDIISAINNNKYKAFNRYLKSQINYKKISVNCNA